MYKIIDNFLSKEEFNCIKNHILNPGFSWNLSPSVTEEKEHLPITSSYYFTHLFWSQFSYNIDPNVKIFAPILDKVSCKAIMRIKANLYPSTEKIMHHIEHSDEDYPHRGAIFYLNTNDGFTILEDEIEVESVENRILLFDPSKSHRSTTCTNDKCRINVNFNFF